jgi:hypothetical protein
MIYSKLEVVRMTPSRDISTLLSRDRNNEGKFMRDIGGDILPQ